MGCRRNASRFLGMHSAVSVTRGGAWNPAAARRAPFRA